MDSSWPEVFVKNARIAVRRVGFSVSTLLWLALAGCGGESVVEGGVDANGEKVRMDSTWTSTSAMATERPLYPAASLGQGTSIGPANAAPTNLFEPSSQDIWSSVGTMAVSRMVHTSTALTDGRVLVTGGLFAFGSLSNTAEIFDSATNMFSSAGTLPNLSNGQTSGRWSHAAARDMQGNVVVTGGELPGNVYLSSSVKCTYDSVAKSCLWTALADMKYPRRAHVFVRLANGRLLAAGGNALGDPMVPANLGARVCEIYDPATNTWTETGKLTLGRADPKGALLPDGRVLVIGGIDGLTLRNTAEIWDPATGTWTLLTSTMSVPRYVFQTVTLSNGKVLAIGGGVDTSATPTNSVDLFDPMTDTFTPVAPMNVARAYHVAELIPDGRVLAAGGEGLASSEVYDPLTNQWTNDGPMSIPRGNAGVSAFGNGCILVSGGGTGLSPRNTAEVVCLELANGTPCTLNTACKSKVCAGGVCCNEVCDGVCRACSVATGAPNDGTCAPLTGNACTDGNACTLSDTCQAGVCSGGNAVTCAASDQCHDAGTCDPATGACSNPAKPDGSVCSDSDACTQSDTCQSGACTGADPVSCSALDGCHIVGMCDSKTGTCSNPNAPDGTTCEGGTCQLGICEIGGMGGAGGSSGGAGGSSGGAGGEGGNAGGKGGAGGASGEGGSAGTGGGSVEDDSGCGCVVVGDARESGSAIGIAIALAAFVRRRRN